MVIGKGCGIEVALFPLLVLLGCEGGCGRNDPGPGGVTVILATPRDTTAALPASDPRLAASPGGSVDEPAAPNSVDVIFNQPMVAVGATTASVTRPPFTIRPRVAGRYRWIGTRTASFVPDEPFAPATRYEGRVPGGLRSVNGRSVAADYTWSFETARPRVTRALPDAEGAPVGPEVRLVLDFNQPVDPTLVRRASRLVALDGGTIGLDARRAGPEDEELLRYWDPDATGRRVVLVPRRRLKLGTEWRLEVSAGLKGTEGPLPMRDTWTRTFRTYGPFTADSLLASRWQTDAVTLVLSNPVDTDTLLTHLTTEPKVTLRGAWQEWDTHRVTLSGDFRAGRTYRLTIRPGLVDVYGQPLNAGGPISLGPVTLPDAAPGVAIRPNEAVLERTDRREIVVLLTNVGSARLEMTRVAAPRIGPVVRGRPKDEPSFRPGADGVVVRTLTKRTPWN
ncbi:MAG TPA: Ig-like domain-containing protein, partial [Candidatus Eisenbacteria bacterium]